MYFIDFDTNTPHCPSARWIVMDDTWVKKWRCCTHSVLVLDLASDSYFRYLLQFSAFFVSHFFSVHFTTFSKKNVTVPYNLQPKNWPCSFSSMESQIFLRTTIARCLNVFVWFVSLGSQCPLNRRCYLGALPVLPCQLPRYINTISRIIV